MNLELRHLRYFVSVAEELHFGRAAKRLHISQPPLSMQIRALEEIVGAQLLLRTQRKVELTKAGEAFLREARQILERAAGAVLAAHFNAVGGHIGVACKFAALATLFALTTFRAVASFGAITGCTLVALLAFTALR